ncbi:lipoprotein [uncultured Cyclobacterium sp.]|uniref:lipoprotein n=1 Tax=uncultured Cyclobacterium sp. TaxID=453820 RepID=UPI0030EF8059
MKKLFYTAVLVLGLSSCENNDTEPRADIVQLLSGEFPAGKHWKLTSFQTTSNYFQLFHF